LDTAADPSAVVVVNNPPGFYYFTARPSIVVPGGNVDMLLQAAKDFDARWVVLDANVSEGLKELYAQPASEPRLELRQTFTDAAARPVYVFQVEP
jgi:hypothetical protein